VGPKMHPLTPPPPASEFPPYEAGRSRLTLSNPRQYSIEPGTKRLKLKYVELLSTFAFNFNLRHYNEPRDFFRFELIHQSTKSAARVGRIHTPHGVIDTPGRH